MTTRSLRGLLVTLGIVVALALLLASTMGGAAQAGPPSGAAPGKSIDDQFADVGRAAPGFGGMFLGGGALNVYLVDHAQRAAARRAIEAAFGADAVSAGGVHFLAADYSFNQLKAWQGRANALFELAGVVTTDVDEAANRVAVGVETASAARAVAKELAAAGIPAGAVRIDVVGQIHALATLRDKVRPLFGGLQIRFDGFLCTLSYNATSATQGDGFVVNSHCTTNRGTVDGTLYYQPLDQVADQFIGTEVLDPPFFQRTNGCPRGKLCRWSDSAYASRASGVTATRGALAKTTGANNGSIEIAGSFSVGSELVGNATVGTTLNKVGRTTGWTQGSVTNSCVNTGVSGSRIVILCQDFVSAGVGGGDSGSPVFRIVSGDTVQLSGTLWGGNSAGTSFVYSPMTNIERELGALATS
jgi:hypothetical protein